MGAHFSLFTATLIASVTALAHDRVSFVTTPSQAFAVRSSLIENEREEILVDMNIAETTGRAGEILQRLCERARAGVRVRLVTDGMSADFWKTGGLSTPFASRLNSECGNLLQVRFWNLVSMKSPFDYLHSRKVRRDHDKIMVFKSQNTAYTGDRNSQNVNYASDYTYFSIDAVVEGSVARDAADYFEDVWAEAPTLSSRAVPKSHETLASSSDLFPHALATPPTPALEWLETQPQFLHFDPHVRKTAKPKYESQFNEALVELTKSARHELIISTPYLRLPDELFNAIKDRRSAGVRVTLVTSRANSKLLPKLQLQNRDIKRLGKIGVILLQKKSTDDLHAKVIVADGERAFMGSHNLNMRGSYMDLEAGLLFENEKAAQEIRDFTLATTEPYVARKSSLKTKLVEGLLKLCSYCQKQI